MKIPDQARTAKAGLFLPAHSTASRNPYRNHILSILQDVLFILMAAGQYEVRHFLDQDGNRGVTLSSKYDNGGALHASETPGPGQYNLSNGGNRGKSPGVRIGTANRYNKSDTTTPGPGQYGNVRINNGPAIKIGSSVRGVMRPDLLSTPGPGSYDLNGMKGSGGITISGHKYAGNKDDIPGPGTYNPNSNATRDRPATAK